MPFSATLDDLLAVAIATFLGAAIGAEREWRRHEGGLRSSALVAAASCIFARMAVAHGGSNPGAAFGAIATGIGFLGGGVILRHGNQVRGLATAATLLGSRGHRHGRRHGGLRTGPGADPGRLLRPCWTTLAVNLDRKRAPPEDNNPR